MTFSFLQWLSPFSNDFFNFLQNGPNLCKWLWRQIYFIQIWRCHLLAICFSVMASMPNFSWTGRRVDIVQIHVYRKFDQFSRTLQRLSSQKPLPIVRLASSRGREEGVGCLRTFHIQGVQEFL
jgi:hypothetical protein